MHKYKYADPQVIRKGPAGFVDLAMYGDVEYRHIVHVPKMPVMKVLSKIACTMFRQAMHINFTY